jgi:putative pantetheine hydrolase
VSTSDSNDRPPGPADAGRTDAGLADAGLADAGLNWRLGGSAGIAVGPTNSIADVAGLRVGNASRTTPGWLTGATVVIGGDDGLAAAVDIRGGGTATRETAALDPMGVVERVQAIYLSGGSAYGLNAVGGVMEALQERGLGFPVGEDLRAVVPIVPAATLFDLGRGGVFDNRPDAAMAREATEAAFASPVGERVAQGSIGAATGAITGEMRGGIGTASAVLSNGVVVAALAVVNADGTTLDPRTGAPWGLFAELDDEFGISVPEPQEHRAARERLYAFAEARPALRPLNTTLVVVATTAPLSRSELQKLAGTSQDGMARAIRPVHTLGDGDVVFAVSTQAGGLPDAAPGLLPAHRRSDQLNQVFTAGADVVTRAIVHGVLSATSVDTPAGHLPSYRELYPGATGA